MGRTLFNRRMAVTARDSHGADVLVEDEKVMAVGTNLDADASGERNFTAAEGLEVRV
ncbi:MAG: hypothetical protein M3Q49_19530 [Actinomycetota bacterium]|nr:hypothetical protein [Actinomycetota bacterium]